ncbi:MAG: CcmD family protein [Flaviaesturariibacter sp.]|nr:CcmD family protein [Flaviaesturariibacter sp.]
MKKTTLFLALLLLNLFAMAQSDEPQMADGFRSNGKIYVVVAVILTIFAGIILYLVRLDRKITKLEKQS